MKTFFSSWPNIFEHEICLFSIIAFQPLIIPTKEGEGKKAGTKEKGE